jgi:2-oxoisovalerate dehydrogenase E1 component
MDFSKDMELGPLHFQRSLYTDEQLIDLYKKLLLPRMIEEKMLLLLRQGRVSKWFSGIGQEAIAVGVTACLEPDEFIYTLHRNLGVFTTRNMPLSKLLAQWQGKVTGYSKGRERSFHFGSIDHKVIGMISHLGPQLALAGGTALGHKLDGEAKVSVAFTGEGGTSEGDFHEALNVAAVWKLPVLFVIENNGYGLSTRPEEQYACDYLSDRGRGYGMEAYKIDGNNILEVHSMVSNLVEDMRQNPRPILLECMTFRRRGHEEASGTKYVPLELMTYWEQRDPIENFERWLIEQSVITAAEAEEVKARIKQHINTEVELGFAEPEPTVDTAREIEDMYAPYNQHVTEPKNPEQAEQMRFIDAISNGLRLAMQKHKGLVLMGQDIAEYGGVFKITEGFVEEFGKARVRNTPICESAIVGIALGLSLKDRKSMMEMQFADFVTVGFNQIVNNLAKLHYRWGQNADVVIRMPTGAGTGAGPFHSQSNEAWFFHTPGLKIVYPSNAHDAKGLLLAAFEDPNPILFFEHKAMYRKPELSENIPTEYYTTEIGKAALAAQGTQCSIITYGMGVWWAKQACEELGISADILDLRTLLPLDYESIRQTVERTNRVLVLHEDTLIGGIGAELAAWVSEHLFQHLDAPVIRVASLDTAVPFSTILEADFLPTQRLRTQLQALIQY